MVGFWGILEVGFFRSTSSEGKALGNKEKFIQNLIRSELEDIYRCQDVSTKMWYNTDS
jgi:hypothetical protein